MKTEPVVHDTFTIERTYRAPPAKVFAAWADPAKKRRWFTEGEGFEVLTYELDFRVGGRERASFREKNGAQMANETVYFDLVPEKRIVFAYSMLMGERPFSASLATVVLQPTADGTRMVFTEQAAFFEGADGAQMRQAGWKQLLDALENELRRSL